MKIAEENTAVSRYYGSLVALITVLVKRNHRSQGKRG